MSNKKTVIASAIAGLLAVSTTSSVLAMTTATPDKMEKCYGISKAGANDCGGAANSCAGSAVKDNQGDAWLFTPKGLCERIKGGSLKPIEDNAKKS